MNIVADKSIPFISSIFAPIGNIQLLDHQEISRNKLKGADVLIVRSVTRIDQDLLDGTNLKIVATPTSGIDHVDQKILQDSGISFVNAPGCNARSVAEYVLSCLFVLNDQKVIQLEKPTVAIVGCGHVGTCVSTLLKAIGVEHLLYDPPLEEAGDTRTFSSLSDIQSADIISLHIPLNLHGPWSTHHFVDSGFLSALKPDATIINTSRGEVVDDQALISFLQQNPQCKLVLDVWQNEPEVNRNLLSYALISTPHIAGYSLDARYNGTEAVYRKICDLTGLKQHRPKTSLLPPTDNLQIKISDVHEDDEVIQLAVLSGYDVRSDSEAFKRLLIDKNTSSHQYFNQLRMNYPARREFSNYTVSLGPSKDRLKKKLGYLGFQVNEIMSDNE